MTLLETPFTAEMAQDSGLSPKQLRLMLADGRLRRIFRGVFLGGEVPVTLEIRAAAATLVVNPHSVLCDRTAAWFHGIDVYRYAEHDAELPMESFVLRGHHPTDRAECHGRTRDLLPEDWMVIDGVLVTTPLRTAVDLACTLSRRDALAALDAFARIHGLTVVEMRRLLARYFRRRGVRQARSLIPLTDPRAESPPESWVRLEIADHELPAPTPQHWVLVDGVPAYRLDLAYPRLKIAVEYDGEEFHSRAEDREHDRERRAWLVAHGWHVIVLTKESFGGDELGAWIGELRDVMRARGAEVRN
jgi:hypothetical protein